MNFITTVGYHDAFFEVEIIVSQNSNNKLEAEKTGNDDELTKAILYNDKIVVGRGSKQFIVDKREEELYRFRVCHLKEDELQNRGHTVSSEDYVNISWDEAIRYFHDEYKNLSLPFSLESYYYAVYEDNGTFNL